MKRPLVQERPMPLVMSNRGVCDYCEKPSVYYHFAVTGYAGAVNEDRWACRDHVGLLNKNFGDFLMSE